MSIIRRNLVYTTLLLPSAALAQSLQAPEPSEFKIRSERSVSVSEPKAIAEDVQIQQVQQNTPAQPLPWQTQNAPLAMPEDQAPNTAPTDTKNIPLSVDTPEAASSPEPEVESEPEEPPPTNTAVLQGLNKVTGHVSKLQGPIGTVLTFDNLEIIPRRCWKSPADEQPENAALLEIREIKTGEEPLKLFMGWMFSSSPGLSGLEHPVYDINIVSCDFIDNPEGIPETKEKIKEEPKEKSKEKAPKSKIQKPAKKTKSDQYKAPDVNVITVQ